jgi:hypothetical protein
MATALIDHLHIYIGTSAGLDTYAAKRNLLECDIDTCHM